jgi:eukaryotic-like serine/threonine-protein kinase
MPEWQQVKEIFGDALELTPEKRQLFLDKACAADESLRREVESLIASTEKESLFMEEPAVGKVAEMFDEAKKNGRIGERFNHYEIIKQIGAGGMGEVYLARDKKLDRKVAVKILNEKFAAHESNLQRFIREAKAASSLNHPNILIIHEIGETENAQYIVSEFIEGETLRELLKLSSLKMPEILDISIQIAGALAAAHHAHIVHRDIKPENIIVRPDGYVKILDFGLAKLIERQPTFVSLEDATAKQSETAQGIIMGTVNYMSPEQAKGERIDERTDVFSFGAVIYEMIAGKAPFAGGSMSETFANLIKSDPIPLSQIVADVPKDLERIVLKTLCKNKDERYQTMTDLLADLREFKENLRFSGKPERSDGAGESEGTTVILPPQPTGDINGQTAEVQGGFTNKIRQHKLSATAAAAIFIIALAAGSYFAFFNKHVAFTSASQIKSVMVLPLKNVGGDAQDEYLSDGITDELTSRLTKLKTVRVVSPSAAMRYKTSPKDAAEIGREMNVEAVIEGTVRKQANKFRVSLSLVNAADGFELWSDSDFNGDISNLLDAQSQIAELMASRLKGELTPQEKSLVAGEGTNNADAYELFLKGKQQYRKQEGQLARDLFDRAIKLDPNFADAYAWRGRAIYNQFKVGKGDRSTLDAALADASHALQIDPNLISARRALINIYHSTGQYEEGLKQGKLALDTNANDPEAIEGAALAYFRAGMPDKAIPLYQRAISADPTNDGFRSELARCYLYTGEYQKGIDVLSPVLQNQYDGVIWMAVVNYRGLRQFDKAIEMGKLLVTKYPDSAVYWLDFGAILEAAGNTEQAREVREEGARREEAKLAAFENVRSRIWLASFYADLGQREKALEQANRATALEPNDAWTHYQVSGIHAELNNRREAIEYLKKSIANGWLGIHYLNFDSNPDLNNTFANLRDDAEFQQIRADLQKKVDELAKQY